MNGKDFTSDFVAPKLSNYITNENFPEELYEIGSKVYITSVDNVEVDSVKKVGDNFRVEGSATVETQTDMGEGDSMDGSYPMMFKLHFDRDGRIVYCESIKVDNSSFFAGGTTIEHPSFQIVPKGDYLHITCDKCEESCALHFRGHDPTMVLVEITCPN